MIDSQTGDVLLPRHHRVWGRVSLLSLIAFLLFFGVFLYELVRDMALPQVVDSLFMQIHSGGHALFRAFGLTAGVAGGTFLQLLVPLALGLYFIRHRQPLAVALCMFFFFEQFLPIARYMADAQAQQLSALSTGRYESVIHDWNFLFSKIGVLPYNLLIAHAVRSIGYLGMVGVAFWLLWRGVIDFATE